MTGFYRYVPGALLVLASCAAVAHDSHLNDAPWHACDEKQLDDVCAYENADHDVYRGSCRTASAALICVHNLPIEKSESTDQSALTGKRLAVSQKSG